MNTVSLKFAELHNPLFFAGRNFGTKLDPGKLAGLSIAYDREEKELIVKWGEEIAFVPSTGVAVYVPGAPTKPAPQVVHPMMANVASTAQVETPSGHVHKGPGHGQTGIGGRVK